MGVFIFEDLIINRFSTKAGNDMNYQRYLYFPIYNDRKKTCFLGLFSFPL